MSELIQLRDGSETADRRLDRLMQFDEKSRSFAVADILPDHFRSKTWALHARLNQGPDGACVGFGNTHRIAALPISFSKASDDYARMIYHEAQRIDPWPGEDYEGTSVLAGVKVAQRLGHFSQYRWCFTIEDYMRAVANEGPVIVGSWWDYSMFDPDERGLLHPDGRHAGGHCYILRGLTLEPRGILRGAGPVFRITNSWGPEWGVNGEAYMTVEDFERYMMPDGEGAVPTEQRLPRQAEDKYFQGRMPELEPEERQEGRGKGRFPWAPGGASLFTRTQGMAYTSGFGKLTGRGSAAGRFTRGPFKFFGR